MRFEQILREKMAKKEDSEANSSSSQSHSTSFQGGIDPAHLAFLMGQVNRSTSPIRGKYNVKPVVHVRKPHVLNEAQGLAFAFLKSIVNGLDEAFSSQELKKAFRQAALKVHPDRGGRAEDFQALNKHYAELKNLFAKP